MQLKTSCPFTEARKVLSLVGHNQALRHVYMMAVLHTWTCCIYCAQGAVEHALVGISDQISL